MFTEITTQELSRNLSEVLQQVQTRNDKVLIRENGEPVAAIIDAALYERIRKSTDRFQELSRKMAEAYKDVPEEEGLAEIDAICQQVRHG